MLDGKKIMVKRSGKPSSEARPDPCAFVKWLFVIRSPLFSRPANQPSTAFEQKLYRVTECVQLDNYNKCIVSLLLSPTYLPTYIPAPSPGKTKTARDHATGFTQIIRPSTAGWIAYRCVSEGPSPTRANASAP